MALAQPAPTARLNALDLDHGAHELAVKGVAISVKYDVPLSLQPVERGVDAGRRQLSTSAISAESRTSPPTLAARTAASASSSRRATRAVIALRTTAEIWTGNVES